MFLVGEHRLESRFLLVGAQHLASQQHPFDAVQRVTTTASVPERDLLDALAAHGELFGSEMNDMEWVHHRPCLR